MSITVYTKPDCPWCDRAKNILKFRNIPFEEQILGIDFDREFVLNAFPSMKTFPIIVENTRLIGGHDGLLAEILKDPNFGKILIQE